MERTHLRESVQSPRSGADDAVVRADRLDAGALLITIEGAADASVAPTLADLLDPLARAGDAPLVIVDLSAATLVDSTVLGVLMRTAKRLRPVGRDVAIVSRSAAIRRLFEVTLLDRLFALHGTLDDALTSALTTHCAGAP